MRLVGEAILRRELLGILRSPRAFAVLGVYVGALGVVAVLAWPTEDLAVIYQAERARKLFSIFAVTQFVLVALLAPVFAAGTLTQEKEKKCIELLLTTPFSADDIAVGKFLSSVLYVCLLVLSSLPILALCLFLGGILPGEVFGLYLVLLGAAAAFGMIGLTCSAYFSRTAPALSVTYLIVLPVAGIGLAIFFAGGKGHGIPLPGLGEGVSLAVISCAAVLGMALAVVRKLEDPYSDVEKSADQERPETQGVLVLRRGAFPDNLIWPERSGELLPDGRNPMFAKEITSEIFGRGTAVIRSLILISFFASVFVFWTCFAGREPVYILYLLAFNLLVTPAFASNSFTQERERGTLDVLLTPLITPWQIVSAKLYAAVRCSGALTLFLCVPPVLGMLFTGARRDDGFSPAEFGIHAGIVTATILAAAGIGMFVSSRARTTLTAMVGTYTACFAVFVLPWLAYLVLEVAGAPFGAFGWLLALSPIPTTLSIGDAEWQAKTLGRAFDVSFWPWYIAWALLLGATLVALTWARVSDAPLGETRSRERTAGDVEGRGSSVE